MSLPTSLDLPETVAKWQAPWGLRQAPKREATCSFTCEQATLEPTARMQLTGFVLPLSIAGPNGAGSLGECTIAWN